MPGGKSKILGVDGGQRVVEVHHLLVGAVGIAEPAGVDQQLLDGDLGDP